MVSSNLSLKKFIQQLEETSQLKVYPVKSNDVEPIEKLDKVLMSNWKAYQREFPGVCLEFIPEMAYQAAIFVYRVCQKMVHPEMDIKVVTKALFKADSDSNLETQMCSADLYLRNLIPIYKILSTRKNEELKSIVENMSNDWSVSCVGILKRSSFPESIRRNFSGFHRLYLDRVTSEIENIDKLDDVTLKEIYEDIGAYGSEYGPLVTKLKILFETE